MTRTIRTVLAAGLVAMAVACDSPAKPSKETVRFNAQLAPANEVPPVSNAEATGSGTATITFEIDRDSGGAITSAIATFQVSLTGFPSGTTLIAAHIHRGPVGQAGNVVVDTGLASGEVILTNGSGSFTKTGVSVSPSLAQEIVSSASSFYFNVHSVLNGTGMARGQLVRQ